MNDDLSVATIVLCWPVPRFAGTQILAWLFAPDNVQVGNHPHCVRLVEHFFDETFAYIIMELCDKSLYKACCLFDRTCLVRERAQVFIPRERRIGSTRSKLAFGGA